MSINARQTGGKLGRDEGFEFEQRLRESISGKDVAWGIDIFNEKKTTPKTDLISVRKVNRRNITENISLKNPQTISTSVQIQICSVDRFNRLFKTPQQIEKEGIANPVNQKYDFKKPTMISMSAQDMKTLHQDGTLEIDGITIVYEK